MIAWPKELELKYTGQELKAGLLATDWYTVVADAKGTYVGSYNATLSLRDHVNTRWTDVLTKEKTAAALVINADLQPTTSYTVMWHSDDVLLKVDSVQYGDVPEYSGITPTKTMPAGYKYTWIGWDQPMTPITGDKDYHAIYDAHPFDVYVTVRASVEEDHNFGIVTNEGKYKVKSNAVITATPVDVNSEVGEPPTSLTISGLGIRFDAVHKVENGFVGLVIGWYYGPDRLTFLDGTLVVAGQENLVIEAKFIKVPLDYTVLVSTTFGSEAQAKFSVDNGTWKDMVYLNVPIGSTVAIDGSKLTFTRPDNTTVTVFTKLVQSDYWENEFYGWEYILTNQPVVDGDKIGEETAIGAKVLRQVTNTHTVKWMNGTDVLQTSTLYHGMTTSYLGPEPVKTGHDN